MSVVSAALWRTVRIGVATLLVVRRRLHLVRAGCERGCACGLDQKNASQGNKHDGNSAKEFASHRSLTSLWQSASIGK